MDKSKYSKKELKELRGKLFLNKENLQIINSNDFLYEHDEDLQDNNQINNDEMSM